MFDFGEPSDLCSSTMLYSANSLYDYVETIPILLSLNRKYGALICVLRAKCNRENFLLEDIYWEVHTFMLDQLVILLIL
jgi:hypothetical protein